MTDLRERTTRAMLWSAIEIAARYAAQFVVTIILARLLAPSDFGLVAMLSVFTSVGALLVDAGFSAALIQRSQINADDDTTAFYVTAIVGITAAIAFNLAAEPISAFYRQPELSAMAKVMSLMLPLTAIGSVPDALLTRRLDFKARTQAQMAASLISGTLAVCVALFGYGVWSLVWLGLTANGVRSVLLWRFSGWRPRGQFCYKSLRTLFGFGSYTLFAGLQNVIATRMQSLLIGRLFDASALGLYTVAQNTQEASTSFIASVLGRVTLPVFSSLANDPERLRNALRRSLQVSMFVFFPCLIGMAIAARPLLALLYGPRWTDATAVLTLLSLAGAMWPLHVLNLSALNAQGKSRLFFRMEVFKNIIVMTLMIPASFLGPVAIAAAVLGASLCSLVVNAWYTKKLLHYGILAQILDQRVAMLLSVAAALPAWAILHWWPPGLAVTAAAIASAICVYLGLATLLHDPSFAELKRIKRNLNTDLA